MGTSAKDDWTSASRAALIGGTTTLIEMICPARGDELRAAYEVWLSHAAGKSACDYTFHMGVPRFDAQTAAVLRQIVKEGIASFKVFLAYAGAFAIEDDELFAVLQLAKQLGVIVTAHCENATLVAAMQQQLLSEGKTGPEWHEPSRPTSVEALGVQHLTTFAELTGAHVYIVHTSCAAALNEAIAARQRGVNVTVEALIQHLLLDKSYAERGDFEGAKFVMSPPLRAAENQDALWEGLATGQISTVATDHAPFDFVGQKDLGRDDFTKIPNGIPSLQDRINLLYTYGVQQKRITLPQMVDMASTQAAQLFGLFPRKGVIAVGSDADLVVFDPQYRGVIAAATHAMQVDYNAFEGTATGGRPSLVTVRGQIQVHDGKFVGTIGRGQLLRRQPGHF